MLVFIRKINSPIEMTNHFELNQHHHHHQLTNCLVIFPLILVLSWWFLPSILMDISFNGKNEFKNKITMIKYLFSSRIPLHLHLHFQLPSQQ